MHHSRHPQVKNEALPPASASCTTLATLNLKLLLHQREGNHISDTRAVGEQHDQPVHTDAQAAGGGQPVLKGGEEVVIHLNLNTHKHTEKQLYTPAKGQ